jgi:hypothetical protein
MSGETCGINFGNVTAKLSMFAVQRQSGEVPGGGAGNPRAKQQTHPVADWAWFSLQGCFETEGKGLAVWVGEECRRRSR